MDAIKEYFRIADKLEHEEITLQEYEEQCQMLRDVQKVVRCKDCKYEDTCCRMIRNEKKPNDFCSYGERRENAEVH